MLPHGRRHAPLECVGAHERDGWKLAQQLTPIVYVAWSLWLFATGVALLV